MRDYSTELDLRVCEDYEAGKTIRELSRDLEIKDRKKIKNILLKYEITLKTLSEANRYYQADHDYFSKIDTAEKAYWLGFLAADGCVHDNDIRVSLSSKDKNLIEMFKLALHSNHPIKDTTPTTQKGVIKVSTLAIASPKMFSDLAQWGIVPNKTFKLTWPSINSRYYRDYIRGYFDGDGSISKITGNQTRFSIIGHRPIISRIQEVMMQECCLSRTKLEERDKDIVILYYCGSTQGLRIYNYLYEDATVFLPRKKERFEELLSLVERRVFYNVKDRVNAT